MIHFNEDSIHIADIKAIIEEAEENFEELKYEIEGLQEEVEDTQNALETYARENDEDGVQEARLELKDLSNQIVSKQEALSSWEDEDYKLAKQLEDEFSSYSEWKYNGYIINKNHFVKYIQDYYLDTHSAPLFDVIKNYVNWERLAKDEESEYDYCELANGQTYYIGRY